MLYSLIIHLCLQYLQQRAVLLMDKEVSAKFFKSKEKVKVPKYDLLRVMACEAVNHEEATAGPVQLSYSENSLTSGYWDRLHLVWVIPSFSQ